MNQINIYPDDCRKWKRKPALDKTLANFKIHFARAFKEAKKLKDTSKDLGYSSHLQSMQPRNQTNAEMFSEMQQDHIIALANLATATKSDRESVSLMSKTISKLTTQIATITKQLLEAHIEIDRLKGNKPTNGGGGPPTPRSTNPMISKSGKKFDLMGYCWLHGFNVEGEHNSITCRQPKTNHDKTTTRLNNKGGKQWNKD